ncbi:thioredoxin [uncultured Caudovirales phage]|uniref:Thioredoxin n=1 Tax=uncultured Caudovirales phage TaxID=2100421 RepID=A0A6J5RND3_9CAUD|nr:thioredoxin [uncultured Caudovirales phage]CAB4193755.1 thioredoxin [uncultured Caudovirales phage]
MLKITNDVSEFQAEDECVVYFTADWCNPCKQLKPHYGRVSVIDPETNYYLVDVDKIDPKMVQLYSIQSIPQVFVMQKGKITETITSRTTETILEELGK